MFSPDPSLFAPEIRPATDEHPPEIAPNLADDEPLCKAVAQYIITNFFIPYLMQAERLYLLWDQIDDMWRATVKTQDLDVGAVQLQKSTAQANAEGGGFGFANRQNTYLAKVSPAAAHKQIDAIVNLGEALSFEGGDLPVSAEVPETVFEHPLYNPTQQGCDAANSELKRQGKEIDLKTRHRIAFGTYVKYGHAFALMDFQRELETVECLHTLPPDQMQAMSVLTQLRAYYGSNEKAITVDAYNRPTAIFLKTVPKVLRTDFTPLDPSAVFVDELITCRPMERQPCPIVRTHITDWELEENPYHPEGSPFGWLNIATAIKDQGCQYALSQPDEQERRNRIMKRWGMTGEIGAQNQRNTFKQLWTAFPLLRIDEATKQLDTGEGINCPNCQGGGSIMQSTLNEVSEPMGADMVPCQNCAATGKVRVPAKRYVVQMFGTMYGGEGVTVLRIQRNPTAKNRVPIAYSAHLVEDTATCRPVSKSEIANSAYQQLTTAHNQFLDSKSYTIRRPWMAKMDSPAYNYDKNQPGGTIPVDSDVEREIKRAEATSYDETATLVPYIQMMDKEVQDIFGANDTVIGEISAGRRAASEITLANEGSKRPLIQQIDQFNHDMMGDFGWGGFVLDNLEYWQDRDWMIQRTGRATWGKLELFTAVGEEMIRKSAAVQNYRYLLEMSGANPALQPLVPKLLAKMLPMMGIDIPEGELDQGLRKNQQMAFRLLTRILGDGILMPPNPDDPDEVYLGVFKECYRDITEDPQNHWRLNAMQNVPLLLQRISMQEQQLMMKQQAQMQQMLQQQVLMNQARGDPRGDQPERPNKPAKTPGQEAQQAA